MTTVIPTNAEQNTPLFTCLSCQIAFPNPEDQRTHYRSDLHRYNMKRRVANLPPVKADTFNQKVLQQRKAAGMMLPSASSTQGNSGAQNEGQENEDEGMAKENENRCHVCSKSFSSSNIYRDHVASRKHKETVLKASKKVASDSTASKGQSQGSIPLVFHIPGQKPATNSEALENLDALKDSLPNSATQASTTEEPISTSELQAQSSATASSSVNPSNENTRNAARANLLVPSNATEEEITSAIDAKIASSTRIDPKTTCIFCGTNTFKSLDESIEHMRKSHGFFLPEKDYLIDLDGLLTYLADKVSVGNICLYCNGKGKSFQDVNSVRKHMLDKSHCKIAYDYEEDKLELSDFYDFSSSYPVDSDEEWEDEEDVENDEQLEGEVIHKTSKKNQGVRYGDSEFELILPSGNRLGHRSLRRYYQQTLWQTPTTYFANQNRDDWNSNVQEGAGTVARRIANGRDGRNGRHLDHQAGGDDADANRGGLVVRDRNGMQVRARNRGEAKEAVRHTREFRDRDRKEQFKTKAMYRNNNQKHFRDHLLQ